MAEGIAPLFTRMAFKVAWVGYQEMLVNGLNDLVAGRWISFSLVRD